MKIINTNSFRLNKAKKPTKIDDEIKPVEQVFTGQYYNVRTMKYHPTTVKFVDNECLRLLEWAELEDSLILLDFIDSRGYNPETFYDWCKKFAHLEEAHLYVMRRLASRREKGALNRKYDASTIHKMMGHYSKEWRSEQIFASRLREDTSKQNDIKIVIEEMPWQPGPMAPCMLDAVIEERPTPEEVAGKIHKLTSEGRKEGAGQYVAKYKLKDQK